jgi:predicted CopG family antitoxin
MRTINETFRDEEFQKLKAVKGNKTWHDFILELVKNEAV